jgi:hypothetical protein
VYLGGSRSDDPKHLENPINTGDSPNRDPQIRAELRNSGNTKEVFGGFYLFEAESLDPVLEIAARCPAARLGGVVEVRPLVHLHGIEDAG